MISTVDWNVASVKAAGEFVLRVTFEDGLEGTVDLGPLLSRPDLPGTVFEPLRDQAFFARAFVEHGAVTWPNGADLAPDAMRSAIAAQGVWQPA
jgi:hypothetical protein